MKTIIVLSHYYEYDKSKYVDYTHNHAKEYIKKGYKVYAFAPYPVLPIQNFFKKDFELNIDGVNVLCIKRFSVSKLYKPLNNWLYYIAIKNKIKKIIKKEDVYAIDAHTFNAEGYAAYKIKKMFPKIKTFITFHGSDLEYALSTNTGQKKLKKYSNYIDWYVCVSQKLKRKLQNLGINNVEVIYNGIITPKLNKVKKGKCFISVGNLIDSKNFELLIDAYYQFYQSNKEYKLKIIGDGYLKEKLIEKVKKLNLIDNVIFLGRISNEKVFEELNKSYAFLLASKPEGFGIVYLEAMYCGCVTVGTKNEGIDGFIKSGENGFLIEPNIDNLLEIMKYITNNNCERIIKQAKEDVKNLTWENNCNNYLSLK